ncbi:MAG: LptA/OstA family protein, partial [Limibaculum sp.]
MRRGIRALITDLVAAAAVMLAVAMPAQAQVPPEKPGLPVALIADTVEYDTVTGRLTASGNVEIHYGERTLTADRIVYNSDTGRITAEGSIVLRDPSGATVFADFADLDAELRDGLVRGARAVMGENIRLSAAEARRVDARFNALSKAVYSPCKVCSDDPTPLWRIRARRVIHDEVEKRIHYQDATFDVL